METISTPQAGFTRGVELASYGIDFDKLHQHQVQPLVLVVDDDLDSVELIKATLRKAGMNVIGASDGFMAIMKMAKENPDAILLDLMMPAIDGWETFSRVRDISEVPVIFVSALATSKHVVDGLNSGVDDYVTKPFHPAELVARVKAVLRRVTTVEQPEMYVFPRVELTIELETNHVILRGDTVDLSPSEFLLLTQLSKQAPRPATFSQITSAIWPENNDEHQRDRIKYLIHQLRQKMELDPSDPQLIQTKTSVGYLLAADGGKTPETKSKQATHKNGNGKESADVK